MLPSREKKVYVCVGKGWGSGKPKHDWYALDDDDDSGGLDLDPVFERLHTETQYMSGFAAWKSLIYIFGGRDVSPAYEDKFAPVSDVFYIDTLSPQHGWKRGPSLNIPRMCLQGVVLDGKICALAGLTTSDHRMSIKTTYYGESLQKQPLAEEWKSMMMMNPPDNAPVHISGHAIYSDKLFVYGPPAGSLHCYDFHLKKWRKEIEEDFASWQYPCASIDEIMYLVEGRRFMGFDLITHKWYYVVGLEEDTMLPPTTSDDGGIDWGKRSSLLHIGNGTLCLLWIGISSEDYCALHCTKFTVAKEEDTLMTYGDGLCIIKATVKSFKIYNLHGGFLVASLALDTEDEKKKKSARDQGSAKDEKKLTKKQKIGN